MANSKEFDFSSISNSWWSAKNNTEIYALHKLNEARLKYIKRHIDFTKSSETSVLDFGCGGGLLCEPLARLGFDVYGVDQNEESINEAIKHSQKEGLKITYLNSIPKDKKFDLVCCFEVLEHVDDVHEVLNDLFNITKNGGMIFLSTINKTIFSLLTIKFAAEYILRIVPKGMHEFEKFLSPEKIDFLCSAKGLKKIDISGVFYNPITKECKFTKNTSGNYICAFKKP